MGKLGWTLATPHTERKRKTLNCFSCGRATETHYKGKYDNILVYPEGWHRVRAGVLCPTCVQKRMCCE